MLRRTTQSLLINSLRPEPLLPLQQKRLSPDAVAELCDLKLDDEGSNRRALGLLPMPANRQDHEITDTDSLRLQNYLLSIESRKISCCIRVFSESKKSRSALLIYRGRLIGCIYGSRGMEGPLFWKPAFEKIMDDLLAPGNLVDSYRLSDEMVLASASLFHGGLNAVFNGVPALQIYPKCANMTMTNKRTGAIVCKGNGDSAACVTYFYQGRIIGVYSFVDGWLTNTLTAALNCIEQVADAELWLSVLPVEVDRAESLTESLTGLDFTPPAHN